MAGNYSTKAVFGQEKRRNAPEQRSRKNPAEQNSSRQRKSCEKLPPGRHRQAESLNP
jgi:hypothetical protein